MQQKVNLMKLGKKFFSGLVCKIKSVNKGCEKFTHSTSIKCSYSTTNENFPPIKTRLINFSIQFVSTMMNFSTSEL